MINDYIYSYILSKNYTNKVAETKADLVDGKVPSSQLPSYVDDVLEYSDLAHFPEEGEAGKIYVAQDTGYTYRWSGSVYVQIGGQDLSDYATKDYVSTAIDNAKELPATLGTAGQVLTVNGTATGVEWANAASGSLNYMYAVIIGSQSVPNPQNPKLAFTLYVQSDKELTTSNILTELQKNHYNVNTRISFYNSDKYIFDNGKPIYQLLGVWVPTTTNNIRINCCEIIIQSSCDLQTGEVTTTYTQGASVNIDTQRVLNVYKINQL